MTTEKSIITKMSEEAARLSADNQAQLTPLIGLASQAVINDKLFAFSKVDGQKIAISAREQWSKIGVASPVIDTLLSKNSEWVYKIPAGVFLNALDDSHTNFSNYAHTIFRPLYKPVQPMLNHSGKKVEYGFNDHTLEIHIHHLLLILDALPIPALIEKLKNLLVAYIYAHDIGNSIERSSHSYQAEVLLSLIFGEIIVLIETFEALLKAVRHHDERVVMPIIHDLEATTRSIPASTKEQSEEFLSQYGQWFSQLDSLLRLVDKLDNGRSRLPHDKGVTQESIQDDEHIFLNALFYLDGDNLDRHIRCEEKRTGKQRFVYSLHFLLGPDERFIVEATEKKNRRRPHAQALHLNEATNKNEIHVPNQLREDFKKKGKTYFESATEHFIQLYHERILLIALDTFNANPDVDEVSIEFIDPFGAFYTKEKLQVVIKPLSLSFTRANILGEMVHLHSVGQRSLQVKDLVELLKVDSDQF